MDDKRKLTLVEDIITGVVCSEVWNQEQMENPEIISVISKLEEVMAEVRPYIPEELANKLEQTIYEYTSAYERGAILHGIHIADTLREVAAKPSSYSKIITNTLKEAQKS